MTTNEALNKAMKLCSSKEYAPFEIEQKLKDWGLAEVAVVEIIDTLKKEKFLDEFRMSRYFANDKLKFNKWGKVKIKYMLQQKRVSQEAISEALDQIDEELYLKILGEELAKRRKTVKDTDEYRIKAKLFQFASGRGFEGDVIYQILDKIV
ncbi:MAG TPA: regulatory protein RecX [Bacteroidales bacterium]